MRATCSSTPGVARSSARTQSSSRRSRRCADALPGPRARRRARRHGRGRPDARRAARAGRDVDAGRRWTAAARARRARRPRDDRLHVRHDRAAEGLHAHPRERDGHRAHVRGRAGVRLGRRPGRDLHVPAARALARARDADGHARRRRHARLLARRPARSCSRTSPRPGPTHFPSVPRVFEKVHTRRWRGWRRQAASSARSSTGRWRRAAASATLERRARSPGALLRRRHALADRLVLSKVRGLFGDRLRLALTGAAPIAQDVLEFFDACGVLVLEGYGLTETTRGGDAQHAASSSGSAPSAGRCRAPRLRSPRTARSCCAGPNVFAGYFRNEEATRETMTSTAGCTPGDLGSIDEDGFVRITGRKKDLIITSSGKNITPRTSSPRCARAAGSPRRSCSATTAPTSSRCSRSTRTRRRRSPSASGSNADLAAMAHDQRVRAEFGRRGRAGQRALRPHRAGQALRGPPEHDLSQADGELTPTLKVKRAVVYREYADLFDSLYPLSCG